MPVKHCCYGDCKSDSRYVNKRKEMDGVFFVPFPKPTRQREKCLRWIRLCGRKYFGIENISKDTYMCSKHFVGGNGPTQEHPDPLPALASPFEQRVLSTKRKRKSPIKRSFIPQPKSKKVLFEPVSTDHCYVLSDAMCSMTDHSYVLPNATSVSPDETEEEQFYFNDTPSTTDHSNVLPNATGVSLSPDETEEEKIYFIDTPSTTDLVEEAVVTQSLTDSLQPNLVETRSISTQTDLCFNHMEEYTDQELQDKQRLKRHLFTKDVLKNNESCKFYTGLNLTLFTTVFTWVQKKAEKMNYWRGQDTTEAKPNENPKPGRTRKLTITEEFMMTLIRLRRGLDVEVLSDIFGIHASNVSRIFITWINLLYLELDFLISWPSREQVRQRLPRQFKFFPKTRCVIDCTEFYIQKPSLPSAQRVTWSQYKHHNTFKALVAISPSGTFIFISRLFTGSISDRRIIEQSGFLDNLEYGDDVMADRGFLIRDLVTRHYATLNIPPFAMGKQMSARAVTKTRRIASARIHVERAIGRLKNFKLLQGTIPLKLHGVLDQIVSVCGMLCNLDSKLVK